MSRVEKDTKHRMRVSCRLELLPGQGAMEQIANARRYGFDGVALPGRCLAQYVEDLKKHATELPLPLSSLSLGFEGSLVSASAASRRACHDSLLGLFDLCAELSIPAVNMPPGLIQDNGDALADLDAWEDLLCEHLPSLADEAQARGVTLLVEPVNRFESIQLNTLASAASVCARVGHTALGITADMFHMQMEERDTARTIRDAGAWIKCFHVASNTREEPGSGSMDFRPAFAALREIGYSGWIEIESRALSGPAEECLPRSVAFLRREWSSAEERRGKKIRAKE